MPTLPDLRAEEFLRVRDNFCPGTRVLEIGGGTGYQASLIAALGSIVESIDVAHPSSDVETYYPVRLYDGRNIPYSNEQFDLVFSSNVLEHIRDLDAMLSELRRVMVADGLAIHILPTPTWRTWTSLSHYVHVARRISGLLGRRNRAAEPSSVRCEQQSNAGLWQGLNRALRDGPHGEYPTALSELWYFSQRRWTNLFQKNGFQVLEARPTNIFYTGYGVFPSVSMERRRKLARILGSATRVYILRKAP
jgi:ubiquinone/menaquinone biosynthesis C-methylase UbiE